MVKVVIVDDHDLVRQGIRKLLEEVNDITVVGEADSGEAAFDVVSKKKPDVVLMDVRMPGMGGMEATSKLMHTFPTIKILAVTSCEEEPLPSRILQAGAAGYLTKGASKEEMVRAVRAIYAGQRYISPEVAQKLALSKFVGPNESPFDSLSERELQVTLMITSGVKVTDISEKLHLSTKTINSYRYRIFEKVGVTSDVELTLLSVRYKLVDDLENNT